LQRDPETQALNRDLEQVSCHQPNSINSDSIKPIEAIKKIQAIKFGQPDLPH